MAGSDVTDAQCGEARTRPAAKLQYWEAYSTLRRTPHNAAYVQLHISTNLKTKKAVRIKSAQRLRADAGSAGARKGAAAPAGKKQRQPKADKPKKERKPSGLDAAAQVLGEAGEPLNAKEIVDRMLERKLWSTGGKTPHATIYAAMIREIAAKGSDSRFRKVERGKFALAK